MLGQTSTDKSANKQFDVWPNYRRPKQKLIDKWQFDL